MTARALLLQCTNAGHYPPILNAADLLADHGWRAAISKDAGLAQGLNVHAGQLTHEAVASALGMDYRAYRAA